MSEACPVCDSTFIYLSPRLGQWVCEDCSNRFGGEDEGERRQLRIFLSYGHDANEPVVRQLRTDLEARGHDVWIDSARLKAGDDWRASIAAALLDSSVVLGFLSAHSVRDPGVCLDELQIALSVRSARIHTVLLEPPTDVSPPSTVAGIQWLDMSSWREHAERGVVGGQWYQQRFQELCDVLESSEVAAFEGEVTLLNGLLQPRLVDSKESVLAETVFSPRPLLRDEIESWRSGDQSERTLVVAGGAGTGKSMLAAHVLHYDPWAICGVFCEWDKASTIDPRRVTELIAFKLALKVPDYRRNLLRVLESVGPDGLERNSDADFFDTILIAPLRQTIDGGRERCYIVIDGLDEATVEHRKGLADLLSSNLYRLPRWLGVVVTTRDEPSILRRFSGAPVLDIDRRAGGSDDDVLVFLAGQLETPLSEVERPLETLSTIAARAGGRFLYAKLFADNVLRGTIALDDADAFPTGLDAIYERDFERRFPEHASYSVWRPILEVLGTINAVPVGVLTSALGLRRYDVIDFTEQIGSHVRRSLSTAHGADPQVETLSFSHKSVADWLGDPATSGRFHADPRAGASTLATWARQALAARSVSSLLPEDARSFAHDHLGPLHTAAGQHAELETFLLLPSIPIDPAFCSLGEFPAGWDTRRMIERLWSNPGRDAFLDRLRRRGEQRLLGSIFDGVVEGVGLSEMDPKTFNLFVDIVHLRGDYEEAVELCDAYLGAKAPSTASDDSLTEIATRRLHHSMFFAPVRPLLQEAHLLLDAVDPNESPGTFNELLFLIGGNLGVLDGNFEVAETWIRRSLEFASGRNDEDFRARSTRKLAEVYMATGRNDEAIRLIGSFVEPGMEINSRYELYLVGALGEAHRLAGDPPVARTCFEQVREVATILGIPGWRAHGELGLAALLIDLGLAEEAGSHVADAVAIYGRIGQAWGRLASAIIASPVRDQLLHSGTALNSIEEVEREADWLGYRYLGEVARRCRAGSTEGICLQFL